MAMDHVLLILSADDVWHSNNCCESPGGRKVCACGDVGQSYALEGHSKSDYPAGYVNPGRECPCPQRQPEEGFCLRRDLAVCNNHFFTGACFNFI